MHDNAPSHAANAIHVNLSERKGISGEKVDDFAFSEP